MQTRTSRAGYLILVFVVLATAPAAEADSVRAGTGIFLTIQPGPVQIVTPSGPIPLAMQGGPLAFFYPPGANAGVVFVSSGVIPDTISFEVMGLSLVSTMPVPIGSSLFDVSVQGNAVGGNMHFNSDGTFDSFFNLVVQIVFTNTATGQQTIQTEIVPMQLQGTWATNIPGGYVEHLTGTLTCSDTVITMCQLPVSTWTTPVPEPATLALLVTGMAGILIRRRKPRARSDA